MRRFIGMRHVRGLASALGLAWMLCGPASAQLVHSKLVPFDGDPSDAFGWRVSAVPGWAFVGARLDSDMVFKSGAVYVYQLVGDEWQFAQKLKAQVPTSGGDFGYRVASSGDWMIASSPHAFEGGFFNAGSAEAFRLEGGVWVHRQHLVASNLSSGLTKYFGDWLAMDGSTLMVGMPRDSFKNVESGSVYVFELQGSTWVETGKLAPADPVDWETYCGFGQSIDLEGDLLAVGVSLSPKVDPA